MGSDCEVTTQRSQLRVQYLHQARRRELTCKHGIEDWCHRRAAEIALVASVTGDDIRPAWGLFGRRCRLRITVADDRERIADD